MSFLKAKGKLRLKVDLGIAMQLRLKNHVLDAGKRPLIMGILNVTPDSFWDGGNHFDPEKALARAQEMIEDGADIIDVGGESTRPGSQPVSFENEIARIRPVVERLVKETEIPISIDTRKSRVAKAMLELGAHMINDVSGLMFDPEMADVVREFGVPVVIMHMRGTPQDMQSHTAYGDVVREVKDELLKRVEWAKSKGIGSEAIIIDPGIGFAKTAGQCIEILARLNEFVDMGFPILIGPSRKSFIGRLLGLEPEERLEATIAACIVGALKGASIVRVHDVREISRAMRLLGLIRSAEAAEVK